MPHGDTDEIRERYGSLYAVHGDSPLALDWGSAQSQRRRFQVLADVADLAYRDVLDVGCGLGHLADYLLVDRAISGLHYTGIDLSADFIRAAAQRRPECAFTCGDAFDALRREREYDVVVASGLLADAADLGQALHLLTSMVETAKVAVAFNVQTWVPSSCPQTAIDLAILPALARAAGAERFVIRADYAPYDATVYLYRHPGADHWSEPGWRRAN